MASLVKRLAGRMGYEFKRKHGTLLLGPRAVDGLLNVLQIGAKRQPQRPASINFESKHLVRQRMAKPQGFLSGLGCSLCQWNKTDTLALRLGDTAGDRAAGPGQG